MGDKSQQTMVWSESYIEMDSDHNYEIYSVARAVMRYPREEAYAKSCQKIAELLNNADENVPHIKYSKLSYHLIRDNHSKKGPVTEGDVRAAFRLRGNFSLNAVAFYD